MKVGIIRMEGMARERLAVLRRLEAEDSGPVACVVEWVVPEDELTLPEIEQKATDFTRDLRVLFVAVPGVYACYLAQKSLRNGIHTFLGRAALPGIEECKAIAALAEEAGVEIGISRITRFHPFLDILSADLRIASLIVLHESKHRDQIGFQQMIEDAVDLCCNLAGMSEVRKIEAQQLRQNHSTLVSLLAGFRFQNGTYAQMQLRQGASQERYTVYAGGGSFEMEVDLLQHALRMRNSTDLENDNLPMAFESHSLPNVNLIERETRAFLKALYNNKSVPVSVVDGLQTQQVIESMRQSLR